MIQALFALSLLSTPALAKDPCKKIVDETDSFGSRTRGLFQYVDINRYLGVGIAQVDGVSTLSTMYVQRGQLDAIVTPGTMGEVKLADGTLIRLPVRDSAQPVTNANLVTVFTQWQLAYGLDSSTMVQLAGSPIVAVRTKIAGQDATFEVPKKQGARLQSAAGCLLPGVQLQDVVKPSVVPT